SSTPSTGNGLAGESRMSVTTLIVSLILFALQAAASAPKLLSPASATKNAEQLGVSTGLYLFAVGVCKGVAVVGIVIGLFWRPMEIVAAGGVALLMIGAVATHWPSGEPMSKAL